MFPHAAQNPQFKTHLTATDPALFTYFMHIPVGSTLFSHNILPETLRKNTRKNQKYSLLPQK